MHPELKAQTEVALKTKDDRSFIDPANFYESERNSGYKNTGNALYELIDNSYEANADILMSQEMGPNFNQHFMTLVWIIDISKMLSHLKTNKAVT